jgi:hypothetical protein
MASMHRSAPLAIESTNLPAHPAALAWGRLGGGALSTVEMWRRPTRTSPSVYRLILAEDGHAALFAKHFPTTLPSVERTVYEEILPRLPVTVPRYHGACRTDDGSTWMFLEDVGDQRMTPDDPGHRALAARWLGVLHASGAAETVAARLPDAGPGRDLAPPRAGRAHRGRPLGTPWRAPQAVPRDP